MATTDATPPTSELQAGLINAPDFLKTLLQILLQQHLDMEMIEHLQATWHERTSNRKGHRNGYRSRNLKTRVGTPELLVPVDRDGTFRTELFEKYRRNEKALVLSIDGDVHPGRKHPQGRNDHGKTVRNEFQQEQRLELLQRA